ncbi:hypothetical protein LOTGIDRAFT_227783 [Lottia gigantea]|uniref:Uncharacterized protein n=1 Tax=Lottia gigantea TaxID=225164 RepID=V4BBT9_LOTGI|nr:hypothetical protein LOTGIDRAFT_227783 [Lottia gigantea]ESP05076.1 hypothetical protein LOTGIDRAFT_227783 [Lottia gigantea]
MAMCLMVVAAVTMVNCVSLTAVPDTNANLHADVSSKALGSKTPSFFRLGGKLLRIPEFILRASRKSGRIPKVPDFLKNGNSLNIRGMSNKKGGMPPIPNYVREGKIPAYAWRYIPKVLLPYLPLINPKNIRPKTLSPAISKQ